MDETSTPCVICGSRTRAREECASCGFCAKEVEQNMFQVDFSSAQEYPESVSNEVFDIEDASFWFQHRARIIGRVLESESVREPILDVGGGNGFEAIRIQEKFNLSALVEPSVDGCKNAVRRGVRAVINGKLENLNLKERTVGTICLFDVLEHLDSPRTLLENSRRLLKDGGTVLVTVPAIMSLWSHEDDFAEHRTRFSKARLMELLNQSGFEVERCSYFFSILILPVLLLRTLPYRLGRKSAQDYNMGDHTNGGIASVLLGLALRIEEKLFRCGFSPWIGTSLIAVARKQAEQSLAPRTEHEENEQRNTP